MMGNDCQVTAATATTNFYATTLRPPPQGKEKESRPASARRHIVLIG